MLIFLVPKKLGEIKKYCIFAPLFKMIFRGGNNGLPVDCQSRRRGNPMQVLSKKNRYKDHS